MSTPIRVVILEDDQACFLFEKHVIDQHGDIEIVGHAETKEMALQMAMELKPDVFLADINLNNKEDQTGIDVAIELSMSMPDLKIIMLSGLLDEDTIRSTMGLGVACNYLVKSSPEKIPQAIRDAYNGISNLDGTIIDFILKDYQDSLKSTMKLTTHHFNVLELFYRGYAVEDVAVILKMEIQSVRNLQQQIAKKCMGWKWRLRKLTTFELAQRAKKLGLF